jgi:hypothetical protein
MRFIKITALAATAAIAVFAAHSTFADPGKGDVSHRVLMQGLGKVLIVNAKGEIEWEAPCPNTSHDIQMLPNGNILYHPGAATVAEITPEKKTVWEYTAKPTGSYTGVVEVHAFQRLKNGLTMVAETGNKRIVEVDKDGKVVHETPLTIDHPNSHRDTRMVRKLDNGNYLVCHEGDGMVREYDPAGKVVWSYKLDLNGRERTPNHDGHGTEVFGAIRLKNGNTLIAGGNNNRVFEVDHDGKTVWSVDQEELPGVKLFWVTTLQALPNGHIIVGNAHAGPNNPQFVEVTRDKKVVWTFNRYDLGGNDLVVGQVLDVKGVIR